MEGRPGGELASCLRRPENDSLRRILPVAVRPGEGPLTETDSGHSTVAAATALPARGCVKTSTTESGRSHTGVPLSRRALALFGTARQNGSGSRHSRRPPQEQISTVYFDSAVFWMVRLKRLIMGSLGKQRSPRERGSDGKAVFSGRNHCARS